MKKYNVKKNGPISQKIKNRFCIFISKFNRGKNKVIIISKTLL